MVDSCHICGATLLTSGESPSEVSDAFVCADCEELTRVDCN